MRQLPDLVIDQRNIRRVHGNVAADTAHGDAHVRFFERGRVVDPVADHTDRHGFALIRVDAVQLILRQGSLTGLPGYAAFPQLLWRCFHGRR